MNKGFFNLVNYSNVGDFACRKCGLYKNCISPKMEYTGHGKKNILIIGEAPGKVEDERNIQFVGKAGKLLESECYKYGVDIFEDCWRINAVNCRPQDQSGNNRKPTRREVEYCRFKVDKTINELKPKFIWLLGNVALESILMRRFSNLSISRWRHLCIPDEKTGAWIIPLYHPSYLLRNMNDNLKAIYDLDLKWAVSCL